MAKDLNLDCYATLGVHPNAEDVVIRAAFKALAQRYHPDRVAGSKDEAHRRMSDLTSAYEILADPVRRRKYDHRQRLHERTALFYIKDSSPDTRPPFAVVDPVSMPVMQRRYSVVLTALMAAVVVLTALNIYQYSGRLRGWLRSSPTSPPIAADADRRGAPDGSIPAIAGAMPSEPAPDASAAKASSSPIGRGGATLAIGPDSAVTQVSPATETDSAPATDAQLPETAATVPPRPPAADPKRAVRAPVAVPQAVATLRKETKPAPANPAAANNTPANRLGATSPASVASEPCGDVATTLGLCKPNSTVKEK
jgi:hypothetical protein